MIPLRIRSAAAALLLAVITLHPAAAQDAPPSGTDIDVFQQSQLLFPPLIANHVEPRAGFLLHGDGTQLRGDIGSSIDVVRFRLDTTRQAATLGIGADFFTWTALRRQENFHFPVDAIDYLFGVNVTYLRPLRPDLALEARFRLSHISAHLVDGRYDKVAGRWIDDRPAQIYSREYFDLVTALDWRETARAYVGVQYIYHVKPTSIRKFAIQAGVEGVRTDLVGSWLHAYAAYDFKLFSAPAYIASHSVQAGVKFGRWHGRGVNLFIAWYDGMNQNGEFFEQRQSFWGPGMSIEF